MLFCPIVFLVTGCGALPVPEGAWVSREDDVARVGCSSGEKTWTFTCISQRWVGSMGNCSGNRK